VPYGVGDDHLSDLRGQSARDDAENACQHFYRCTDCGAMLKPQPGDCCVFCSYADAPCPPKQAAGRAG